MKIVRATFHLNDADLAALKGAAPKLSRIPPAHWRGIIQLLSGELPPTPPEDWVDYGEGLWLTAARWVSAEQADQKGIEAVAMSNRDAGFRRWQYVRAEKFEGEAP